MKKKSGESWAARKKKGRKNNGNPAVKKGGVMGKEELSKLLKDSYPSYYYEDYFDEGNLAGKLDSIFWVLFTIITLILFFFIFSVGAVELGTVKFIESSNSPQAYNKITKARGLYQITPVCLTDYNSSHSIHYTQEDLFNPKVNHRIANWYLNIRIPQLLNYYGIPDNTENRLIAYNWGIGNLVGWWKRLPKETRGYLRKYQKIEGGK